MRKEDWRKETYDYSVFLPLNNPFLKLQKEQLVAGVKHDSQKIPLELLPSEALFEIGKVLQAGKEKYGTANWAQGIEISRLLGAAMRHIAQFNGGEDFDEETKTLHIANAACNLLFAIWMMKNRPDLDDRWDKKK